MNQCQKGFPVSLPRALHIINISQVIEVHRTS